jgi:hypothetical protein
MRARDRGEEPLGSWGGSDWEGGQSRQASSPVSQGLGPAGRRGDDRVRIVGEISVEGHKRVIGQHGRRDQLDAVRLEAARPLLGNPIRRHLFCNRQAGRPGNASSLFAGRRGVARGEPALAERLGTLEIQRISAYRVRRQPPPSPRTSVSL